MREPRFRVWNNGTQKYIIEMDFLNDGAFIGCSIKNGVAEFDNAYVENPTHTVDGVVIEETLMEYEEYTGLKDKNGVEIYEGDIVIGKDETQAFIELAKKLKQDVKDPNYKGTNISQVLFVDGAFSICNSFGNYDLVINHHSASMAKDLEVIGNIHENPELLKGAK